MTDTKKDDKAKAKEPPHVESEAERQDRLRKEDASDGGRSDPDGSKAT